MNVVTIAENILACALPILFEDNVDEEIPYYHGGSGFLLEHHSNTYFVTAKHCLQNSESKVGHLLIPASTAGISREFLPFDVCSVGHPNNLDDPDCADFVILRVKTTLLPESDRRILAPFILTDRQFIVPSSVRVHALFLRGYPMALKHIDYDSHKIKWQAFMTHARYVQPDTSKHCHVLDFAPSPQIDPNGMSGSPVVAIVENGIGQYTAGLAGMVIRGGKGSDLFRFIGADVLLWGLRNIVR